MTKFMRIAAVAVFATALAGSAQAQDEQLGSAAPEPLLHPGWVFTPSFSYAETYDDNITLFGDRDVQNHDLIAAYSPHGTVTYYGKHTRVSGGYGGSFLNYRTFSLFDRWDQSGEVDFKRQETRRLSWYVHTNAQAMPSTEAIEFNGIPYSHTAAFTVDGRGGAAYKVSGRDTVTSALQMQYVSFDRPGELTTYLRGGDARAWINTYRRKINSRTSLGADYTYRTAHVLNDVDRAVTHTTEAAVEYALSDVWSVTAGAGYAFLKATPLTPTASAPSLRASIDRTYNGTHFHAGYAQGLLPSFGFGGTVNTQEAGLGFFTPLFNSRHFYTDHSAVFRDNDPVFELPGRLRLRSLRTSSVVGWAPQPWVHIEGFYSLVMQSSLIAGGRLDRNRIGFRITTSKPVRMQ
jgi:hypothetical protein